MARKGNNPEKMDTDQETGSKRRYRSPQTPPQAPGSQQRSQQTRDRERQQDGQVRDAEEYGDGRTSGRGTSQEYGQGQRQGRGLTEDAEGAQQRRQGQDWQEDIDIDDMDGMSRFAGAGSDFDLQKASRDELNAIARELEIEDFETMNREELVMEIRERS